jgi:hypothetical protein
VWTSQAPSTSKTVVVDAGSFEMISHTNALGVNPECYKWMQALLIDGLTGCHGLAPWTFTMAATRKQLQLLFPSSLAALS